MKQPLFRKFMDSYIPSMKNWYGWDAKFLAPDEIVIYDEDEEASVRERCIIEHEWTEKMNQNQHRHVCVMKETESRTIFITTEKDNQILYIECSIKRNKFYYNYCKWEEDTSISVDLSEKAVLDRIFEVFQDLYENEPKNRLLFVTGQLSYYHR